MLPRLMILSTFLAAIGGQWLSSPIDNCDGQSRSDISSPTTFKFENRRVCYFVVDGANDRANVYKSNMMWDQNKKFAIDVAREICKSHGATLPIFKSKSEEQHVLSHYEAQKTDSIALDLFWRGNKAGYVWSDGTALDPKLPSKHVKTAPENVYSYTTMRHDRKIGPVWYDVSAEDGVWNGVAVVCRQESTNKVLCLLKLLGVGSVIAIVVAAVGGIVVALMKDS